MGAIGLEAQAPTIEAAKEKLIELREENYSSDSDSDDPYSGTWRVVGSICFDGRLETCDTVEEAQQRVLNSTGKWGSGKAVVVRGKDTEQQSAAKRAVDKALRVRRSIISKKPVATKGLRSRQQSKFEACVELDKEIRARYRNGPIEKSFDAHARDVLGTLSDPFPITHANLGATLDTLEKQDAIGALSKLCNMQAEFDKSLKEAEEELAKAQAELKKIDSAEMSRVVFGGWAAC